MCRVVYLSDDVLFVLNQCLAQRDTGKERIFYTRCSSGLCYSAAKILFFAYLNKAGFEQRGCTIHYLCHTFASELFNAGKRLKCLQQLLGRQDVEMTREALSPPEL